jgi:hypothetical protein
VKKLGLIVFRWLLLSCVITVLVGVVGESLPMSVTDPQGGMGRGLLMIAVWVLGMIATLVWAVWARPGESISMRSKRDLFLISAGTLSVSFLAIVAIPPIYKSHQLSQQYHAEAERREAGQQRQWALALQQDWDKGRWQLSLPRCVEVEDKGLNSQCPSSFNLTYCWKMDADKDWGLRGTDCALGEQASVTIAPGFYAMPVPWCRAYSVCKGQLHVLDAVAIRSP